MSQDLSRPGDVPLTTSELIYDLVNGRIQSNGTLTADQLKATQILARYGPTAFPIAVLIYALRQRDEEIRDMKSWISLYDQNSDAIGKCLEPIREKRPTGEPAHPDHIEVCKLVRERGGLLTELATAKKRLAEMEAITADRDRLRNALRAAWSDLSEDNLYSETIKDLHDAIFHPGTRVFYVPGKAIGSPNYNAREAGVVKESRQTERGSWVFVLFDHAVEKHGIESATAQACSPEDLVFESFITE